MARIWLVLGFILGITFAVPQAFAAGFPATPNNTEVARFPLMDGPLSAQMQAILGLQPAILPEDTKVFNHQRKTGEWKLEWLPAGTSVLVDGGGLVRYKTDCGNRLMVEGNLRYLVRGRWSNEDPVSLVQPEPQPRLRTIPQALANILRAVFWEIPRWILFRDYVRPNPVP